MTSEMRRILDVVLKVRDELKVPLIFDCGNHSLTAVGSINGHIPIGPMVLVQRVVVVREALT